MRDDVRIWAAAVPSILALAGMAWAAPAKPAAEFAPLANPPGIQLQPLGLAQGYSLNKESAAALPHDKLTYANDKGMTLYFSDADSDGKSVCVDDCAKTWIPARASASPGIAVDGWTVIARPDGTKQWALRGKPLYTYIKDEDIGSVGGNSPKVSGRGPMVGPRGEIQGPLPPEQPLLAGWHPAMLFPADKPLPAGFKIREVEDSIGLVLTNEAGHTLYVLDGDVNKEKKICGAGSACDLWQPVAGPRMSVPVAFGDFSFILREDGIKQWAYKGRGLYSYGGDLTPMDANGIGVTSGWSPAYYVRYFVPSNVIVKANVKLGKVWATTAGQTLYKRQGFIYQSGSGHGGRRGDTVRPAVGRDLGTNARCREECDKWHPFVAPAEAQPSGYWDVATREDGRKQWVYQGYALWTYDGDTRPSDINGNDTFDFYIGHDNKTLLDVGTRYDWPTALYWIIAYP